ncbi:MAG TPA: hypothetical protein VGJ71_11935 [Candidatus Limnocylindrales bacterium]|jgi:hypothetical protein
MTDADELDRAEAEAAADAAVDRQALIDNDEPAADTPSAAEYSVAFTPRNLAVGLAIVAGLVAFAASRRRRRARGRSGEDG